MQAKIQTVFLKLVQVGLITLLLITLLGALQSIHLDMAMLSSTMVTILLAVLIVGLFIGMIPKLRQGVISRVIRTVHWIQHHDILVGLIVLGVVLIVQGLVIYYVQQPQSWDVSGTVIAASSDTLAQQYREYYSFYPNNLFLMSVMRILRLWSGVSLHSEVSYWVFFQVINVIVLDLSAIILFVACRRAFGRQVNLIASAFYMVLMLLSPYIQVPYSDTFVLLPICLVFMLSTFFTKNQKWWWQCLLAVLIGLLLPIIMAIKPSAVVFVIAWGIVVLLRLHRLEAKKLVLSGAALIACVAGIGLGHLITEVTISNYSPIKIQADRALPWQHWVGMGMVGTGAYNTNDVLQIEKYKTTAAMKKHAIKVIKKRIHDYSFRNYVKFIVVKQQRNMSDGDFAWGVEGRYMPPFKATTSHVQGIIRSIYSFNASHQADRAFVVQIVWIALLIGLIIQVLTCGDIQDKTLILQIAIAGGCLFLLLFEGGRSRYIIQFLPELVIVAAAGWHRLALRKTK